MSGTSCAEVETFASIALLPRDALALLDEATGIFAHTAWWETAQFHALPAGSTPAFVAVRSAGRIIALMPMLRSGSRLGSFTTPYTCEYTPLFTAGLGTGMQIAAMAAFGRLCRPFGTVRIDALPVEWDGLTALEAGAARAGLRALRFDHFGNWYEDVSGLDWSAYLLGRPGALRETVRRRLRRAEKLPEAAFALFTRPAEMERASEAFEAVYQRSWKEPEPYPSFNVALMRALARRGLLRLGVWSIGAVPVAVQFWTVQNGYAIVLKLAHDEAFKVHSPGTVLTALMVRHLLDHERVGVIDFGRGDDSYKQGWASQRRQRIGLLLANPRRISGVVALLRHAASGAKASRAKASRTKAGVA